MLALQSAFGLCAIIGLAWLISERRQDVIWRSVIYGVALQFVLALALLKVPPVQGSLAVLNDAVSA